MPRKLKRAFKYKCLEVMCNTVHRNDKWLEHCRKKHFYKLNNNLDIKYKILEVKEGDAPWRPYVELTSEKPPTAENKLTVKDRGPEEPLPSTSTSALTAISRQDSMKTTSNSEVDSTRTISPDVLETVHMSLSSPDEEINIFSELNPQLIPRKNLIEQNEENKKSELRPLPETSILQYPSDSLDPAFYANKKLSPELINEALKLETQDLSSITFPATSGRKFNPNLKKPLLPNGSTKERMWLVYSKHSDAVFCLHCLIFSLPTERTIWGTVGYRGWTDHRGDRDVELHEKSKNHVSSQIARLQWISHRRVDKDLTEQKDNLVNHHREVLSVIIDCCRYLTEEMLAFRNKDSLNGKLVNLFRLLAKYNPDARVYLEKLEKHKKEQNKLGSNLLSYRNIFDLINIMNNIVVSKIVERVNETKTFSIILDSTQDVSKKECTAVLIRYVEHRDGQGEVKENVKPEERLVKVFTSGDTTGENLSIELLKTLQDIGVDKTGMVGQSMDGAGNMRGRFNGVKSFVLKECPKAYYIWCCSHRFALVVEKSMDICQQTRDMFSIVQELYVFMSGHKKHHVLVEKLDKGSNKTRRKRLKRVNTTRWSSKSDAVSTVLSCYDVLRETLEDIANDKKSDTESKSSAKGLLKALSNYDIVATMQVTSELFSVLSPVTLCLQSKNIDYGIIPDVISNTKSKLVGLRSEDGWCKMLDRIKRFTEEHHLQPATSKRIRKRKRFMDELALDETLTDSDAKMRTEVFFRLLDSLLLQLQDRFPESSLKIVQQMTQFSHENLLKNSGSTNSSFSTALVNDLCEYYELDPEEICEEYKAFSELYKVGYQNIDLADVLHSSGCHIRDCDEDSGEENSDVVVDVNDNKNPKLAKQKYLDLWLKKGFLRPYRFLLNLSGFPYLNVLYCTILALPATSCSAERVMSKLKIVKNRLRSSMGDLWLSEMLVLAAEKDILKLVSNQEIIDKFASSTEHRKKLLFYKGYRN